MSHDGIASVARSIDDVRRVITALSEDEWRHPSGCDGWTVRELVAHMSASFKETVEPSPPPGEPVDMPAERLMDLLVAARDGMSNEEICAEYLQYCDPALAALTALQEEPVASQVIPIADLGHYPMHQLADAFAFDHYCHLRIDLLAPHGPIERDLPAADDALIAPAIGWMLTGIPQMQPGLERELTGRLRLELTGPGHGTWDLTVESGTITIGAPEGTADATVTSTAHDFVRWGTVRSPWRDHCVVACDDKMASRFLDALNVI